jgi:ADP-ribose pyrophosphatase YjhB (NUDIX family)
VGVLDTWRFCPVCKTELEREATSVRCPWCGFVQYANSAPTANALVEDDEGRVMLTRRAHDPDKGLWDIPGGFLEEAEHPLDGVRRELKEETGLDVEPEDFLVATVDWYDAPGGRRATVNLVWTARIVGGQPEPADDVSEIRFFAADELPGPDELAFEHVQDVLAAWLARKQHA